MGERTSSSSVVELFDAVRASGSRGRRRLSPGGKDQVEKDLVSVGIFYWRQTMEINKAENTLMEKRCGKQSPGTLFHSLCYSFSLYLIIILRSCSFGSPFFVHSYLLFLEYGYVFDNLANFC